MNDNYKRLSANHVTILYSRISKFEKTDSFDFYFAEMPDFLQFRILRLKSIEDRQRSLIGKLLLRIGLKCSNISQYSLNNIRFTKFQRPYLCDSFDFNISHSNEIVICAISKNTIGVDIEEIRQIELQDFNSQLSKGDLEEILKSENGVRAFFKVWTKKEAFLKAIGSGLSVPMDRIRITDDRILWDGNEWFLQEITIDQDYIISLCTTLKLPEILVEEVKF